MFQWTGWFWCFSRLGGFSVLIDLVVLMFQWTWWFWCFNGLGGLSGGLSVSMDLAFWCFNGLGGFGVSID